MKQWTKGLVAGLFAFGAFAALPSASPAQQQAQSAAGAARQQVTAAQAEVTASKKEVARVRTKVEGSFEGTGEYVKAQKRVAKAKAAYDAALRKTKTDLLANDEYKSVVAKREAAKQQLDAARNADDATIGKLTAELTEAGLAMKKMELDSVASSEAVSTAKEQWDTAKQDLAALDGELREALESDQEYLAAEQALATAEQQLQTAKESLAQVVKSEAEARRAARPVRTRTRTGER